MSKNVNLLIDPTEYRAFLRQYIKDLYEIDAPMIAGAVERCLQKLEAQPTMEAVHGRWVLREKAGVDYWCCSVCDKIRSEYYYEPKDNYCPNCGAKMDK